MQKLNCILHWKIYILVQPETCLSQEMCTVRNVEEQELRMARLSSAQNVMDRVKFFKECKWVLECKCKCRYNAINAEVEET